MSAPALSADLTLHHRIALTGNSPGFLCEAVGQAVATASELPDSCTSVQSRFRASSTPILPRGDA